MLVRAGFLVLLLVAIARPLLAEPEPLLFEPLRGTIAPVGLRHPVVFVHGIFHRMPARGTYFRGVPERLRQLGVPASFPMLGFANGVADRSRLLAEHVRATWPTGRINVIAHSIGGMATRDFITRLGFAGRVASLTMVSSPHRGTPVADWVVRHIGEGLGVEALLTSAGMEASALRDLTTRSSEEFNARTPDAPGVLYFSLPAAQAWYRLRAPLQPFGLMIRLMTRARAGHPLSDESRRYLARQPWGAAAQAELGRIEAEVGMAGVAPADREAWEAAHGANDGVVPLTSSPWGISFGRVDMDHLDQIGWGTNGTESADFYEYVVRMLAARGF
jgi:triacylglycerol lipase